jgi:hypothetical protein
MKRAEQRSFFPCCFPAAAAAIAAAIIACGEQRPKGNVLSMNRPPDLFPCSSGTVIPPNIAPLNFTIKEHGSCFFVSIAEKGKTGIAIASATPGITIPARQWNSLFSGLSGAEGRILGITVYCRTGSRWSRYETVWDTVAADSIDPYVVYRKIPICKDWTYMGIFQRDLQSFREKTVYHNAESGVCCNCHSFRANDPDAMALEIRSKEFGTPMLLGMLIDGKKKLFAVNTKSAVSTGRVGFTSWHPHENLIAFTMNNFKMFFSSAGHEPREVFDAASDVALYDCAHNKITSVPALSRQDRIETMPEWSSDGCFLYVSVSPQLPKQQLREIRCDLLRIAFDARELAWGTLDTVMTAQKAGGSILQPRCSPDGRYILVNIAGYGDFPIDKEATRLGVIDLQSSSLSLLDTGNRWTDGWHGWSHNGRWMVFTSKRINGRFSCICFSYFDSTGTAHAPFVLPQKNPSFYESSVIAFNVPEFLRARITYPARAFRKVLDAYRKNSAAPAVAADGVQYE